MLMGNNWNRLSCSLGMMWGLHSPTNPIDVYYLPNGGKYIIGRKDTNIVISGDPSVSRRHASISVQEDGVVFSDLKSKFGSEVNGKKVTSDIKLCHNDILRIGQGPSSLRLMKVKFMFCCSNMPPALKKEVKASADQLGGVVVSNWTSSCTHLVMTAVTVTVKVVNALSICCPIVTPSWIRESVKCLNSKEVLPSLKSYQPPLIDGHLRSASDSDVSLVPLEERRQLFRNKHIYFLDSKQHTNLRYCLTAAGGTTHMLVSIDTNLDAYCNDNSLVMDPGDRAASSVDKEKVGEKLASQGLRFILEAEIGHAILHVSIERFSNPKIVLEDALPTNPLPSASLSQAPFSFHTQSSLMDTQQSDITVLAHNTELSQMGVVDTPSSVDRPANQNEVAKVDESVIKEEPMDAIDSLFSITEADSSKEPAGGVVRIKHEPQASYTTSQSALNELPSSSLQLNATILAMDSLPPFVSPTSRSHDSSVPNERVITSAFKNKKRNRDIGDGGQQQSGSNAKRIKSETQKKSLSKPFSPPDPVPIVAAISEPELNEDLVVADPPSSPPPAPVTPISKPAVSPDGFLSARKRTPVKAQTQTTSSKRLCMNTQDTDTENPFPSIARNSRPPSGDIGDNGKHQNSMPSAAVPSLSGFISARRKPVSTHPTTKEDQAPHQSIDTSPCPKPIVESANLVRKKQLAPPEPGPEIMPGIINFKKFRKTQNPGSSSSFDRMIGGSGLAVYLIQTRT